MEEIIPKKSKLSAKQCTHTVYFVIQFKCNKLQQKRVKTKEKKILTNLKICQDYICYKRCKQRLY